MTGCVDRATVSGVIDSPVAGSPRPGWRGVLLLALAAGLLLGVGGCHRPYYRKKADREVAQVLADKDKYPAWKIENWHVYPDPRSRFADGTDPDRPPMPPDDPASFFLSPNPQKPHRHAGIARVGGTGYLDMLRTWDEENRLQRAAEPKSGEIKSLPDGTSEEQDEPQAKAETKEPKTQEEKPKEVAKETQSATKDTKDETLTKPAYLLTLDQAVELGLVNSREFQDRREDLYLAALPVTTERFAFATQFFATEQAFREWAGRELPLDQRNRWRLNSNAGFTKTFSTGALLLLRFANQTVINLTGTSPNRTVSESVLDLDFVQPLLRGGGRAVTLEPLTQVERNLLYEIRDYARFRKEFYVSVANGQSTSNGSVSVPGAGTPGSSPLATGIGVSVRPDVVPGSGGRTGPIGIAGVNPQGYLQVVLLRAQLENERQNLEVLRTSEEQFRNLFNFQQIDQAQFNQVRQQRLGSQTTIYQRTADYGNGMDRFKLQLGLPTDLPLELDPTPLRAILKQVEAYENVYGFNDRTRERPAQQSAREVRELLVKEGFIATGTDGLKTEVLDPGTLRRRLQELVRTAPLLAKTPFPEGFLVSWSGWEKLPDPRIVQNFRSDLSVERRRLRDVQYDLESTKQPVPELIQRRIQEFDFLHDLGGLELRLRLYEQQLWKRPNSEERQQRAEQESQFRDVIQGLSAFLLEAREEVLERPRRERLRQVQENWPRLPSVCIDGVDLLEADEEIALETAGRYALTNRFDLMNVRGQVVDTWRKIAVAANSLLGTFNVEYNLTSLTPDGLARPFAFAGGRTRHRLIFNGELPIVRLLERNQYRATLIAYQRQRRALMEAEDQILATVRAEVRQVRNVARNYNEIQKGLRQNLDLAYFQVDLASEFLNAPPSPTGGQPPAGTVGPPTAGRGTGGDPAALTQQYLGALRSLVGAKNELYRVWIDYQSNRLALYRDLELMPLDSRGVWIDDTANSVCSTPARDRGPDEPKSDGPETGRLP